MRISVLRHLIGGLFVLASPAVHADVWIGFLESAGLRVGFVEKGGKWSSAILDVSSSEELKVASARYVTPATWTLFFDGKEYGKVTTKPFRSYTAYGENGLIQLSAKAPDLAFRKVEEKFAGWAGESQRPVLASTAASLADSENWKPSAGGSVDKAIFKDLLKQTARVVHFCRDQECESEDHARSIKASEVKVRYAYRDKAGNRLIGVALQFAASVKFRATAAKVRVPIGFTSPSPALRASYSRPAR